jgi:hypothetical protein
MCRFIAYLGKPILINDVISKPADSLIKQSIHAMESDVQVNMERLNGVSSYRIRTEYYIDVLSCFIV